MKVTRSVRWVVCTRQELWFKQQFLKASFRKTLLIIEVKMVGTSGLSLKWLRNTFRVMRLLLTVLSQVTFPVRIFKLMGVESVLVTNASGGICPDFKVGDIMIIKDHINLPGFAGQHPLCGPNDERWEGPSAQSTLTSCRCEIWPVCRFGIRFPCMSDAYSKDLRSLTVEVGSELGCSHFLRSGVYCMVSGPNFETIAEARMLLTLGCDSVGKTCTHTKNDLVRGNFFVFTTCSFCSDWSSNFRLRNKILVCIRMMSCWVVLTSLSNKTQPARC